MQMIILSRLHRGDYPHYRPMTAVQSDDPMIFVDQAGVDAFLEAYRHADKAAGFIQHVVPVIGLRAYWETCRDHDWHYANSDDGRVYREGGAKQLELAVQSKISREHFDIYAHWKKHHSTGPAYGNEKWPAPDQPTFEAEPQKPWIKFPAIAAPVMLEALRKGELVVVALRNAASRNKVVKGVEAADLALAQIRAAIAAAEGG